MGCQNQQKYQRLDSFFAIYQYKPSKMLPMNLAKGLGDDLFLSERKSPNNMKEKEKTFCSLLVQLNTDESYQI